MKMPCKARIVDTAHVCAAIVALISATSPVGAAVGKSVSSDYPTKPIRIIVLNTPGAGADILARLIGSKLTEGLGQQVVIDNRPGGGGNVGCEIAARAAPDGYTLLMITSQQPIVVAMYDKLNYDLIRDFAPISLVGTTPLMLITNPAVAASSIKELVALAKSEPGQLNYGSPGSGSSGHLAAEVFKSMAGINITHVPYKGTPQALNDMIAGQVQLTFLVAPAAMPFVKAGKVRALGVTTTKRSPLAPDVPTIGETLPGFEWSGWYGLVAPARTPEPIIAKLNAAQLSALKTGDLHQRLLDLGANPVGSTPQEYAAHLRTQIEKMRQAIKISGARPD